MEVMEAWPPANYVDPVTQGSAEFILNVTLFPLVCIVIAIRIFTRLRISKNFGGDDWLIVAAMVCTSLPSQQTIISLS